MNRALLTCWGNLFSQIDGHASEPHKEESSFPVRIEITATLILRGIEAMHMIKKGNLFYRTSLSKIK